VTSYSKPYKTLPEQVALLRDRGMAIGDEPAATAQLLAIGYYRLSGYCYTFREHAVPCATTCGCPRRRDNFVVGTTLKQVVDLYEFDRALRLAVRSFAHHCDSVDCADERFDVGAEQVAGLLTDHLITVGIEQTKYVLA
jgi:abortive infection bacteriophage resistance protein